jgi:uncharacterized membrane protein YdbT with pleckstrin-like domain
MNPKYHIAKRKYIYDVLKSFFTSLFLTVFSSSLIFETEEEEILQLSQNQAIIIGLIFLLSFIFQLILYWLILRRFLFSDQDKSFLIEQGLIIKRKTNIPYKNIHTISIKRRFRDIIFGLSTLQIDTGTTASFKAEANVVVDKAYAPVLKEFIEQKRDNLDTILPSPDDYDKTQAKEENQINQLKWSTLMLMGILKPGFLAFTLGLSILIFGFIMTFMGLDTSIHLNKAFLYMIGLFLGLLLLGGLGFMLFYLIKYYHYRISIDNQYITYRYGLLNKVEFKLSKTKINAAHINQSLLYRFFGYYELNVSVLGIGDQNPDNQVKIESKSLLPIAKKDLLNDLLTFTDFQANDHIEPLRPKKYGKLNFIILPIIPLWLISIIPYIFFNLDYSRLISPILIHIMTLILGSIGLFLRLNHHQFYHNNDLYEFQRGPFTIKKSLIKKLKIQMISYQQHPLLLLEGIGNIQIRYKDIGGILVMRSYPYDDFMQFKEDLVSIK